MFASASWLRSNKWIWFGSRAANRHELLDLRYKIATISTCTYLSSFAELFFRYPKQERAAFPSADLRHLAFITEQMFGFSIFYYCRYNMFIFSKKSHRSFLPWVIGTNVLCVLLRSYPTQNAIYPGYSGRFDASRVDIFVCSHDIRWSPCIELIFEVHSQTICSQHWQCNYELPCVQLDTACKIPATMNAFVQKNSVCAIQEFLHLSLVIRSCQTSCMNQRVFSCNVIVDERFLCDTKH